MGDEPNKGNETNEQQEAAELAAKVKDLEKELAEIKVDDTTSDVSRKTADGRDPENVAKEYERKFKAQTERLETLEQNVAKVLDGFENGKADDKLVRKAIRDELDKNSATEVLVQLKQQYKEDWPAVVDQVNQIVKEFGMGNLSPSDRIRKAHDLLLERKSKERDQKVTDEKFRGKRVDKNHPGSTRTVASSGSGDNSDDEYQRAKKSAFTQGASKDTLRYYLTLKLARAKQGLPV